MFRNCIPVVLPVFDLSCVTDRVFSIRIEDHHQRFEKGAHKYQPTCRPNRRGVAYDAQTGVAAWGG